ncbi:MAG: polyphosphate polymerase domain-containing protein [Planctomycetes bacterium]|nr:polyphosphate polymerase domain-containing protein [Planctomycetota bacterium]
MSARLELKYLVDLRTRLWLQPLLSARLAPGEFVDAGGGYPVLSLYYDGENLPLYLEKLAGVERRMKVRLRTYAWSFGPSQAWFLEGKHKDGNLIAKRRLEVPRERIDPLRPATWDALGPEGASFLHARESLRLVPTVQVWYQREVLVSAAGDLRVTWDSPIRALFPGEPMTNARLYDETRRVVPDQWAVLEIKARQTLPAWLAALVREAGLVPETISKYVRSLDTLGLSRKVLSTC